MRFLGGTNKERETAGSLAALGMTTRKATATATAKAKAKAKAEAEAEAEADSLRE